MPTHGALCCALGLVWLIAVIGGVDFAEEFLVLMMEVMSTF
jgi:hypothetical protein